MEVPVPKVKQADVLRIIDRDFPVRVRKKVLSILNEYKEKEVARVHLAILKLSAGQMEKLPELVRTACGDYRDVLSPAEYPEFDKIGFVGVDDLTTKQRNDLIKRDWDQYQAWLSRS